LLLLTARITDGSGGYVFKEVEPGDYAIVEVIRDRFSSSSSDYDNSPKSDVGDSDTTKINNLIAATLKPGKDGEDNNFVDDYGGAISGKVRNDQGNPLANVMLELFKGSSLVDFVFTNARGENRFCSIKSGDYVIKETNNPFGYPPNAGDRDVRDDSDAGGDDKCILEYWI
jgi:uncharacterized surface anchored protein